MKKFYFFIALLLIGFTGTAQNDVTFSVDMSGYGGAFTTVYVSGELNGWSGTSNPMTDMGGGIWSATISLASGEYQYKFTIDDWTDQENFMSGDACTVLDGGFVNRIVEVNSAMTLDTPNFTACYDDGDPGPHDMTLTIDMSGYTSSFTTVYVSGAFNGWSGNANPMTDMGGNIWSATISLPEAQTEFKFTVDDWTDQEFFADGDLGTVTNGGFTNRFLNVLGDETRNYAWGAEGTLSTNEFTAASFKTYPNPTNNAWNVVTDNVTIKTIQVYDIAGRQVSTMQPNAINASIDGANLKAGIYFATIQTDKGESTVKLVKN